MVGVARSKGCRICVQRRVKCDQTRPTCNNCKKGNRPCPGYGQDLKFQDEGVRLRKRFERNETGPTGPTDVDTARDSSGSPPDLTSANTTTATTNVTTADVESITDLQPFAQDSGYWDVVGLDVSKTQRRTFIGILEGRNQAYAGLGDNMAELFTIKMEDSQTADSVDQFLFHNFGRTSNPFVKQLDSAEQNQNALLTKFQESLFPDTSNVPQILRNHSRWISLLPPLTGTNPLLDASVRAVTLVHIGRLNNSEPFVMESRPYYGQALRLLNKALQSRSAGMSNETLCAVILLSFYEMFASDSNESWVRHAGGVSALMRTRGPARHRHGFDREIFLAYRYTLIIEAFEEDVPCFLAEPAWVQLSHDIHEDLRTSGIAAGRVEIFDLAEEFYCSMVIIPELCAHARALWFAKQNNTPPPYNRAQLIEKMTAARVAFKTTFTRFEAALKKAGHAPTINLNQRDPLVGIEYEFINTFVSSTYTGYWTVLIVLNLCLQGLQSDDTEMVQLYQTESKGCSLNICRSSAFMLRSSFLGPFFLIFGLRVSLIIFEDLGNGNELAPEADWILRKLFEIGDRHMGIAKHVPGYRAGISVEELIAEFGSRQAEAQKKRDRSEKMEFNRQVTHGDIFENNPSAIPYDISVDGTRDDISATEFLGERAREKMQTQPSHLKGKPSSDWQSLTQVEDVLRVWNDQDNFQLQTNEHNLNVPSNDNRSRSSTRSPQPPGSTLEQQQLSHAAATLAMPDMSFFDPTFNMENMPIPEQTPNSFFETEQPVTSQPVPNDCYQAEGEPTMQEMQQAMDNFNQNQYEFDTTPPPPSPLPPPLPQQQRQQQPRRQNTLPRGLERFFQ